MLAVNHNTFEMMEAVINFSEWHAWKNECFNLSSKQCREVDGLCRYRYLISVFSLNIKKTVSLCLSFIHFHTYFNQIWHDGTRLPWRGFTQFKKWMGTSPKLQISTLLPL
jgi:hypothetical protein